MVGIFDVDVGAQVQRMLENRGYGYISTNKDQEQGFLGRSTPLIGPRGESQIIVGSRMAFELYGLDIDLSHLEEHDGIEAHALFLKKGEYKSPCTKPRLSAWYDPITIIDCLPLPGMDTPTNIPLGRLITCWNGTEFEERNYIHIGNTVVNVALGIAGISVQSTKPAGEDQGYEVL